MSACFAWSPKEAPIKKCILCCVGFSSTGRRGRFRSPIYKLLVRLKVHIILPDPNKQCGIRLLEGLRPRAPTKRRRCFEPYVFWTSPSPNHLIGFNELCTKKCMWECGYSCFTFKYKSFSLGFGETKRGGG